jgi:hypothetical protein
MAVRFFNDWGPDNKERLLIEIEFPTDSIGERHAAVHAAKSEDIETYAAEYETYAAAERKRQGDQGEPEEAAPAA